MNTESLDTWLISTLNGCFQQEQYPAAEFLIGAMHASGRRSEASLHLLAEACLSQGNISGAWGHVVAALQANPSHPQALEILQAIESVASTYSIDDSKRTVSLTTADEFLAKHPSRGKISEGPQFVRSGKTAPLKLYQIDDMLVTGPEGVAFDYETASFFKDAFQSSHPSYITLRSIPLQPTINSKDAVKIPGVCAHLCGQWSGNYFHWINELLTRAYLLKELGFDGSFLTPACNHPFIRESLEMIGISPERLIPYDFKRGVSCDSLVMFEPFDFSDAVNNPRIWEQVRSTLLEQADKSLTLAPGVNGVYIARSGLRSVKNEASLVPLFERHKIVAMRAEALSIRQQVRIASLSRILVGPHGSGITNSLFMPRESAVVELLPALMLNACFYHIAKILNHRYYTVPTTPTDHDPDKERVEPSLIYLELILEQELSR
jgi:hypothetical protein